MKFFNANKSKLLITGLLFAVFLFAGSCQNWMSNDDFMSKIENEVHDANAKPLTVYVRFAHDKMGKTEPSGSTSMKVDVASKVSAVPGDDYGFVKWAAFSTADFPANKNHSELTYISEEAYNQNFKQKEIPSDEVQFSNPTEQVTEVKIKKARNDIFIIPIVAARPAYVQSVPAGGDTQVVKNTSIRILFSKAIDKKTIVDSEGKLNYSITSSAQTFVDDDQEIVANDITDHFDWKLSDSGKMLTLSLKEKLNDKGEKTGEIEWFLDNRQRITITLFEGLCDVYGFSMNGNYTFNFSTGTNIDSLAPMIDVIYGGTGDKCDVFVSFHSGEIDGKATDASKKAPKDITSEEYTDALVAQRIYDKLNLYIAATDIIAAGNKDISFEKEASEDNVNAIGIAASLYIDKDGNPVTVDSTNSIPRQSFVYIPGSIDQNSELQGLFSDYIPQNYTNLLNLEGTIYTYDLSNLPDGLIKIDVWAVDMTGNSAAPAEDGSANKNGSPYYTKHDNGYKSIFVVKDTTPPDSVAEAKKIISNSAEAPYYWYNSETLSTMQLYDLETNPIVDAGHVKLRSLAKNLSWNFVVGKSDKAPASTDAGWKLIHNQDNGASIKYEFSKAQIPSADGPVDVTLFIRDDIGNVSAPVLLDSIKYDNTKPTVSLKNGPGDFVDAQGKDQLHASKTDVINQILKVDFTEPNENNAGSGIRRVEIYVEKDGQQVAVPLDASKLAVKYAPASIANAGPSSEGVIDIAIAADDTAATNNLKVLKVTDASKMTTGTLFIYGLTLGTTDGRYTVKVDLYDSAMNKTTATAVTAISRDTTNPVVNKVFVEGAQSRVVYGQTEQTWWLPYTVFEGTALTKASFKINIDENGSGIKKITLSENAEFTDATELWCGTTKLVKGTDYNLDLSTKTIELTDWYTPRLLNGESNIEITLKNIKLTNPDNANGNKVSIIVNDFVSNAGTNENGQIFYTEGDTPVTGTIIYGDSTAPQIAALAVEDTAQNTTKNPAGKAYDKAHYTDSRNVILTLTLGNTELAANGGSGVDQIILSDNAVFTDTTKLYVDGTELTSGYTIAENKKSVSFDKVFINPNVIKFTEVQIISETDGEQIIKADVKDFAGLMSQTKSSNTIVYDHTNPVVNENGIKWIEKQTGVTLGSEKDLLVDSQSLTIDFTEETAGVKFIKLDIIRQAANATTYASPFGNAAFGIDYNGTALLSSDYTREGQYIIFNTPYKTGSFTLNNLTLDGDEQNQGTYVITVSLFDAAENVVPQNERPGTYIIVDNIKPVITQDLAIDDLIVAKELTTSGISSTTEYWLNKNYVGGTGSEYKNADAIPVKIKINEANSGIKLITFTGDAKLSTATTVKKLGSNEAVDFTVNTQNNTITVTDALKAFKDENEFTLLVENVGFAKIDSAGSSASGNFTVTVSDVAMNTSDAKTLSSTIRSDSKNPDAPENFKLKDRAALFTSYAANEDYTNESTVNMEFKLNASEYNGSGYHKFHIEGAKFTSNSELTIKTQSGNSTITNAFELSDNNTTLTLKSDTDKYVLRAAVNVTITNVQLNSESVEGTHSVTLTAYDLTGWSASASDQIIYDCQPPAVSKIFTANYTNSSVPYYQPASNVYPHADEENATGVILEINSKNIPVFYTATSYDTGKSQTGGVVDTSSYGAVLGIRATDNIGLGGYARNYTFLYYKSDDNFTIENAADVISGGTLYSKSYEKSNKNAINPTNDALWFGLYTGNYSAVICDEAGNASSVFHFKIVKDTTTPANFGMNLVTIEKPENSGIYRTVSGLNIEGQSKFAFDFKDSSNSSGNTSDIYVNKYVIKKTGASNRYKIVLKFNGTQSGDELLTGSIVSTPASYNENFAATTSASPIEKYAISTWYGVWQNTSAGSSAYGYQYHAAVPMNTVLPNGIQLTNANYSTYSSQLMAYFGYSFSEGFAESLKNCSWLTPAGKNAWYNYAKGTENTDTGSGITSYVDDNNNLVIELPDTNEKYLPPITVFLRDGCGNMKSLLIQANNNYAIGFLTDGKLGWQNTDSNNQVTSPIAIQNPYMNPAESGYSWDGSIYGWNNQSGNNDKTNDNGVGEKYGYIKDFVKNQTYYNDALSTFKLGLTLRFGEVSNNKDYPETVLFNSTGKTTSTTDYTCRAILYTTTDAEETPAYSAITAGKEASDWIYAQVSKSTSEITMLLDYPKPSYTQPFYIWYLLEDRIGNYEIAKVVNSAAKGNALRTNTEGMFDKWVYDNQGPVLTTRQNGLNPEDVEDINELVGSNNGFVPYAVTNGTTKTVYVHASKTHRDVQTGETINDTAGTGTTHVVDGHPTDESDTGDPIYNSFADLAIDEITGVRAFAWSTDSESPSISDELHGDWDTSKWYKDTTNIWYVGWLEVANMRKNIGVDHDYQGKPENAYFAGDYDGKYSGIKLCTIFPYAKLSTTTPTTLYIHLIDWTGNISSYRIGKNIQFKDDSTPPEYTPYAVAGTTVADQYYISKEENVVPVVRIAGKGQAAKNQDPINVYIPSDYFTETSGIKGFTLEETGINSVTEYLSIPYETYHKDDENTYDLNYYVYDNVGNRTQKTIQFVFDEKPPKISTVSLVTKEDSGTEFVDSVNEKITDTVSGYGKVFNYEHPDSAVYHDNISGIEDSELQVVYLNKTGTTKFHINLDDSQQNYYVDVDEVTINKWVVSNEIGSWNTVARYNKNVAANIIGDWSGDKTTGFYMGTNNLNGYDALAFDANGTYYQILVSDISGNTSCQYFRLFLDNTAPTFVGNPVLTITKGSVNKIGETTNYAYTSTSTLKAKLTVNVTDAGVGTVYDHYEYKIDNGSWTAFTGSSFNYEFYGIDVEKIYIRDAFGKESTVLPKFSYTYNGTTVSDISKLVSYGSNPSVPDFSKITVKTKGSYSYSDANYDNKTQGVIRIKKTDRTGIQITFTNVPNTVMGYIESDTTPSSAQNAYTFVNSGLLKKVFEYTLPMKQDKSDVTKDYYAIDYAGNVSEKLSITYTYTNPHEAQGITFLSPTSTDVTGNQALLNKLEEDNITLAQMEVSSDGKTYYVDSGYVLIRCTLYENSATYTDNPKTLNLYSGNSTTAAGTFTYGTNQTDTLKRYLLGETSGTRYICYLAFPISAAQDNKKLWCTISGEESTSAKTNLTATEVTWSYAGAAPAFVNASETNKDLYEDETETVNGVEKPIHKIWGYIHSTNDGYYSSLQSQIPMVKDNNFGEGYNSNHYAKGTNIYILKSKVSHKVDLTHFQYVTSMGFDAVPDDSKWTTMVTADTQTYWQFTLPDMKTPHTRVALFLKDKFGHVSDAYYIGNNVKADNNYQKPYQVTWWIMDQALSADDIGILKSVEDGKTVLTVDIPAGIVVKSVSIPTENAQVEKIWFKDYVPSFGNDNHADKGEISLEKLADGWINISKIKVTLKDIAAQTWTEQPVSLKINNTTKEAFKISAKELTEGDIESISQASEENVVTITLKQGVPANAIKNISVDGSNFSWQTGTTTVTLTDIPNPSWTTAQNITLTVNTNVKSQIVKTIDQRTLTENDITIGDATESNGVYTVALTLKNGAPESSITSVQADNDVKADRTGTTVTLSNIPAAGETDKVITLTVNGTIAKAVLTIAAEQQQSGNPNPTDPANNPDINSQMNFYSALFKGVNPAITQGVNRVYGSTYTGSALLGSSYAEDQGYDQNVLNEQNELNEQVQAVSAGEKVTQSAVTVKTTDAPVSVETSTQTSANASALVATAPVSTATAERGASAYEQAADTQTVEAAETTGAVTAEDIAPASELAPAQHSAPAIIVVLIALFAATAGIWVGCKKRRILV